MSEGSEPLLLLEQLNLNDAANSAQDVQSDSNNKGSDLGMRFFFECLADLSRGFIFEL
jgi:hypothetical protein